MVSCSQSVTNDPTPTFKTNSSPQVVVTAWTAELTGTLLRDDGCIQVRSENDETYTLVWPSDLALTIENDGIKITKGIVSGNREDTPFNFGDIIYLSGGETEYLDEQLQKTINEQCLGPYWVVGFDIKLLATEKP
jgi:hypothetical protein